MKFIPLLKGSAADESLLSQEYAQAEEFAAAKLGATCFFFKAGRKIYYLPLSEITRCFRRVELVNARMGCCNQGLPMESIVVCGAEEQELAQIRFGSERMSKAVLSALEKVCPQAKFGYERPPEQETAVRTL